MLGTRLENALFDLSSLCKCEDRERVIMGEESAQ